jgi:Cu(I)/Ag(I) efflux system membrane protein CusA/SilA
MIEAVIEWSMRNRALVFLVALATAFVGARALMTLPVDAIPDLSENQVVVFTDWLGRSPQEIEDQITYPLSVKLQGLAGIKVIRASSEFNFSMISVIFDEATDYYFARNRVMERLSLAPTFLPPGVTPYLAPDATSVGQIFWYTLEGEGKSLDELRALQDWFVRYQLGSVPGVAEVASVGGAPREYQVDLDPNRLRAYGVTLGEVYQAVERSNSAVGGRVIHQGNAEFVIRSVGWLESLDDLRRVVVAQRQSTPITVGDLGVVQIGPQFRRSVLEKDGREAVGGVVMMRHGENPLEITRRLKDKITSLSAGLPKGVRVVPFYDRTPLIQAALQTIGDTVKEEIIICTLLILLIMGHLGGAFIVSLALPLAVLFAFLMMRLFGIGSNIMSLAGIAISVGILVDQAVVMTDNAAHYLTRHYGRAPVKGQNLDILIPACRAVGRPIFFSVLITIVSFLPVFALSGMEGKMFHPLAWTKTFALIGVALLSITLVPALIPVFLRGRIKSEQESRLVRAMVSVFKPLLTWLMDRPTLICWFFACIVGLGFVASTKLGREFMPPIDEGSILEMPTGVPRTSVAEAAADLRARDAVLRGFPEVWQVVGKAGRAETATDPAPLDMIETIINLRHRDQWPKRQLRYSDAIRHSERAFDALNAGGFLRPISEVERAAVSDEVAMLVSSQVDIQLRAQAADWVSQGREGLGSSLVRSAVLEFLGRVPGNQLKRRPNGRELSTIISELSSLYGNRLAIDVLREDVELVLRGTLDRLRRIGIATNDHGALLIEPTAKERALELVADTLGSHRTVFSEELTNRLRDSHAELMKGRVAEGNRSLFDRGANIASAKAVEAWLRLAEKKSLLSRTPSDIQQNVLRKRLTEEFVASTFLWRKSKADLIKEIDTAVQMPGWGNIFTQPIINRIDMLATGVRTAVGVKVFGPDLKGIQRLSQEVAAVLKTIPGAVDVVPDQVVGKPYIEIHIDREKAARYGVQVADIQDVIEVALGGKPLTTTVEGRERYPVRVRYARAFRSDLDSLKKVLVSARGSMEVLKPEPGGEPSDIPAQVPLELLADIRVTEGPSMIKSENGILRSYVQLNVRDRDIVGFVEEARRVVSAWVALPEGFSLEWSGQFEHQERARKTLQLVFPAVIGIIVLILYLTYKSWTDAFLMLTSVAGALAGGAIFQWLFGFPFSVAVWVGYIACFGMATETSIVMLVYLREAIAERGGLQSISSVDELRQAILDGAIHRMRPKLLTEGTTILAIAPMLWTNGVGSEVIRPMAAPVLGGLLIADEVIDLFLPVLYFAVQKRRWQQLHRTAAKAKQI